MEDKVCNLHLRDYPLYFQCSCLKTADEKNKIDLVFEILQTNLYFIYICISVDWIVIKHCHFYYAFIFTFPLPVASSPTSCSYQEIKINSLHNWVMLIGPWQS